MTKITYEYVKEFVECFGYKLISKEYTKSGERLDMICNNGHECSISWDNFKYGRRCRTCADIKKSERFRFEYEEVKNYIESFGCKLKTKDYENNTQKLEIECTCGNVYKIPLHRFKEDDKYKRCIHCRDKKSKKHSYDYVYKYFLSEGYELLSKEYQYANEKVKVKCPEGHVYDVTFANFQYGKRCPKCFGSPRFDFDEVVDMFKNEGYTLLDKEYKNSRQRLNIICDKGHNTTITLADFRSGCRCKICNTSKGERFIAKYLNENGVNNFYNEEYFNDLIGIGGRPLRPDFILPDNKVWIEYDGEFHYRKMYDDDGHEKIKIHDKRKDEYAKKHNWKMIRIPYWEFDNIENILNKEIV